MGLTSREKYLDDMTKMFEECTNGKNKFTKNKERKNERREITNKLHGCGSKRTTTRPSGKGLSLFSFFLFAKKTPPIMEEIEDRWFESSIPDNGI